MTHSEGSVAKKYTFVDDAYNLFDQVLARPEPSSITELWAEHLHIRKVMESVREAQSQLSDTDEKLSGWIRTEEKRQKLLEWAKLVKIELNDVDIVLENDSISLKATKDIEINKVIVRVPRSAMLTTDQARKSTALRKAIEKDHIVEMGNISLALHICVHWMNGEGSRWHPYIDALPRTLNCPIFYTVEELLSLKPSCIFKEALSFYRVIARQFTYFLFTIAANGIYDENQKGRRPKDGRAHEETPIFYNTPFTINNFTFKLYQWAVGIVTTRVNLIPSSLISKANGDPEVMPALIPIFDMANHDFIESERDSISFCGEEDAASITVPKSWKAGEEVKINYGKRTNHDHLLHNGFVPRGKNPEDTYDLRLGMPKTDKQFAEKMQLVFSEWDGNVTSSNVFIFGLKDDNQPFEELLLRFARIFVTQEPTEEAIKTKEVQLKAINFLRTRLELIERSYGKDDFDINAEGRQGDINRLKHYEIAAVRASRLKLDKNEAALNDS